MLPGPFQQQPASIQHRPPRKLKRGAEPPVVNAAALSLRLRPNQGGESASRRHGRWRRPPSRQGVGLVERPLCLPSSIDATASWLGIEQGRRGFAAGGAGANGYVRPFVAPAGGATVGAYRAGGRRREHICVVRHCQLALNSIQRQDCRERAELRYQSSVPSPMRIRV